MELAKIEIENLGLVAHHNMPCGICLERHAVYNCQEGRFSPCWQCQNAGWRTWRRGVIGRMIDRVRNRQPLFANNQSEE